MTTLDGFTAGLLLEVASMPTTPDDHNRFHDLVKELTGKKTAGPSKEARAYFERNLNKRVKVLGTEHIGTITELNEAKGGFYPGSRYPIFVKIEESGNQAAIGDLFEYDLDQLELLSE